MTRIDGRMRTALFWGLVALLVAAHIVNAWTSLTATRFWEDEAYNLSVPRNLVAGLGYTSDATLSGGEPLPFDPRISTGPVVLLSVAGLLALGVDDVTAARIPPLLFFGLLVAAAAVIGRRLAGRWGALIAAAVPLVIDASALPSPIQGPADLLGEIAASALLLWALIALQRRPWIAGLLVGLAVQAKYITLLALPAFAIALVLVVYRGKPWPGRLLRGAGVATLVAVPTALVELAALVSLGVGGFKDHLWRTYFFVRSSGTENLVTSPLDKVEALLSAWRLPAPLVVGAAALAAVILACALLALRRDRVTEGPEVRVAAVVSIVGLATYLGWWLVSSHTPVWVRHPAPALFAFVPALAALTVLAIRHLRENGTSLFRRPLVVAVSGLLSAVLLAQVAVATTTAVQRTPTELDRQHAVAAELRRFDLHRVAVPWGGRVSEAVLAGLQVAEIGSPAENLREHARWVPSDLVDDVCGAVLGEVDGSIVCSAP